MRELETRRQLIRVATLALALAGCGDAQLPEACTNADEFSYDASYTELAGTCGVYTGHPVWINHSLAAVYRMVGNTWIIPEHHVVECTFRMMQTAQEDGVVIERVSGDLPIREDGSIGGEVMLQRFDRLGATTCSGEYDLVLTPILDRSAR